VANQTQISAKNANQANELAEIAKNNAEQGNKQMAEMLNAMKKSIILHQTSQNYQSNRRNCVPDQYSCVECRS